MVDVFDVLGFVCFPVLLDAKTAAGEAADTTAINAVAAERFFMLDEAGAGGFDNDND